MYLSKINYAKLNDKIVHIDEVPNGINCKCVCLNCGKLLVAKNNGKVMEHHFAHYKAKECKFAYETMLHKLAKEIFEEDFNFIILPTREKYFNEVCRYLDESKIYSEFVKVEIEKNLGNFTPDILLKDKNSKLLLVEIKVTHEVDDEKREKIINKKLSCLEIDLSNLNRYITKNELKEYIKNNSKIKWINLNLNKDEREKILNDFIKYDIYEILPENAKSLYFNKFCGIETSCKNCSYSFTCLETNQVLCRFKLSKYLLDKNIKIIDVIRDNKYFITAIKYIKNNEEILDRFKTYEEIINELEAIKEKTIFIGKIKYFKEEKCSSIQQLWKQKKRSTIKVINKRNEIFEISKTSYKSRSKNKFIQALKLNNGTELERIIDYNKKNWYELKRYNE